MPPGHQVTETFDLGVLVTCGGHDVGSFDLIIPDKIGINEPPSAEELRLLREEIDPDRFYI